MVLPIKVISFSTEIDSRDRSVLYLINNSWDDFHYKTSFSLTIISEDGLVHDIGTVKIGFVGQPVGRTTFAQNTFSGLGEVFFSLGQGPEYYQSLNNLETQFRNEILVSLRDIVFNDTIYAIAIAEAVTRQSLLRFVSTESVTGQYRRLLSGGSLLTDYNFHFKLLESATTAPIKLTFAVDPEATPPTNMHVLIGRNGVGKTHILNNMVQSLVFDEGDQKVTANFEMMDEPAVFGEVGNSFSGVVSVAFSAFDPFDPVDVSPSLLKNIRYSYVGLKRSTNRGGKRGTPMSHEMLTNEFVESLTNCCSRGMREMWEQTIGKLDSDPMFGETALRYLIVDIDDDSLFVDARKVFKKLSSGHAIVLLTITKLVEKVEEKTLVLIDEPEGHLHPPLLASFIRALSGLLDYRNGVAVIATHSPVILQEVPRSCVWKIHRSGLEARVDRPQIETFGENVGTLTREVFQLEVMSSGYHAMLNDLVESGASSERVIRKFNGQLGMEGRAILSGLIAVRDGEAGDIG